MSAPTDVRPDLACHEPLPGQAPHTATSVGLPGQDLTITRIACRHCMQWIHDAAMGKRCNYRAFGVSKAAS